MLGSLTQFKRLLSSPAETLPYYKHAIAGSGAGICVCFVATPIEMIKAQLQVQYGDVKSHRYKGPVDCALKIISNNGILGLWRGFGACCLYRSGFAVLWSSYAVYTDTLNEWALKGYLSAKLIPFLAGGLAANTFWTLAFPTDVVKNRIMSQPDTIPRLYPSIRQCILTIYRVGKNSDFK